jgi:SulP family sulfate permease
VAGYVAAATVVVLVVAFGAVVGQIPEAVIGGLLFVIGVELVLGRLPDARLAVRTGARPMLFFGVTLVLTLAIPLQWAILTGAFLSLAAFVVASASHADLQRVEPDAAGWSVTDDIPAALQAGDPLLLRYTGPNFFAEVPSVVAQLPAPAAAAPGVLVLDVGDLQDYSSTMLKALSTYQARLASHGSGLVLIGVREHSRTILERTGLLEQIGPENVLATDPHLVLSLERGMQRARALLAELERARRDSMPPQP